MFSVSHCHATEGSKRRATEKSVILSQGVGTLLQKICCPAWGREGLYEGARQKVSNSKEILEFSSIVRLKILNCIYQILEW